MLWMKSVWLGAALVVATIAIQIPLDQNLVPINLDHNIKDNKPIEATLATSDVQSFQRNAKKNKIEIKSAGDGLLNSEQSSQPNKNTKTAPKSQQISPGNGETDGSNNNNGDETTTKPDVGNVEDETVIQTTTGPVKGHAWRNNANIISYIDIKYGVFSTPFATPVAPDKWETVHDVKDHSKRCPQLQKNAVVGDTDCLTLSIFKPLNAHRESVLFHIHEGNFTYGSGNPALYGPEYLASKGVILVLPNYRLGPFGFLCLQNATAEGNAALKDLTLALSWVKDNIDKFGGDPNNVAVSGDGTSGALAGYLALSPMSEGYISKVITESGSVLSYWALDRNPLMTAANLTSKIKDFKSWSDLTTSNLLSAAKDLMLRPCLERVTENGTHFMVETPWTMIHNKSINITFMIGSAMYAGVHETLKHTAESIQQLNNNVELLLPNDLKFDKSSDLIKTAERVKIHYFNQNNITRDMVEQLSLYYTDIAYLGPGVRTARSLIKSGATVYFYEFSFVGDLNRELVAIEKPVQGAVIRDIVGYLYTQDGNEPVQDTKERKMVEQLVDLWTNFMKSGKPSAEKIVWTKLKVTNATEEQWLSIATETKMQRGVHVDRLNLWTEIYTQHFVERNVGFANASSIFAVVIMQISLLTHII